MIFLFLFEIKNALEKISKAFFNSIFHQKAQGVFRKMVNKITSINTNRTATYPYNRLRHNNTEGVGESAYNKTPNAKYGSDKTNSGL